MEKISKQEALLLNQKWYFTGELCKNNHIDKRYVNTGICYSCKRDLNKTCNTRNKNTLQKISKRAYEKNKDKSLKYSKQWAENNRERSNNIKKKSKLKNIEKTREQARLYMKKKRRDPYWRLAKNTSKSIWECLKNKKNQLTWLKFVDYSLQDLITHLESKFKPEMTWNNYGEYWHLDHIKPLSLFNLELEFKDAWSLSNLQPLEAKLNWSKCNRFIG